MKTLPLSFAKSGFQHDQLRREGLAALYRRHKAGQPVHFEVIRIRELPERRFPRMKESLPAQEAYPGSESWGTLGWTFTEQDQAEAKYRSLLDRLP